MMLFDWTPLNPSLSIFNFRGPGIETLIPGSSSATELYLVFEMDNFHQPGPDPGGGGHFYLFSLKPLCGGGGGVEGRGCGVEKKEAEKKLSCNLSKKLNEDIYKKKIITQPLQICIGPTISIG